MVAAGLCEDNKTSIKEQVAELVKLNDEGLDALARVVGKHLPTNKREEKFTGVFRRTPSKG
jgi:hypothetical protein